MEFSRFAGHERIMQKVEAAEKNGSLPPAVKYHREGLDFLGSDEVEDSEKAETIRQAGRKIGDLAG